MNSIEKMSVPILDFNVHPLSRHKGKEDIFVKVLVFKSIRGMYSYYKENDIANEVKQDYLAKVDYCDDDVYPQICIISFYLPMTDTGTIAHEATHVAAKIYRLENNGSCNLGYFHDKKEEFVCEI